MAPEEDSETPTSEESTSKSESEHVKNKNAESESSESELSNSDDSQTEKSIDVQDQSIGPNEEPPSSGLPESDTQEGAPNLYVDGEVFANLTAFQRNILIILAEQRDILKGLELKKELKEYYSEEINHGRLYPNLDTLADEGLIEKTEVDKRTNGYHLTSYGFDTLQFRHYWFYQRIKNNEAEDSGIQTSEYTSSENITTIETSNLSEFQFDILIILSGRTNPPKGVDVKKELEAYYGEEVNHGRLYPNLDTLAEEGLIEKTEIDARSNGYNLTSYGADVLRYRYNWLNDSVGERVENSTTQPNEEYESEVVHEENKKSNSAIQGEQNTAERNSTIVEETTGTQVGILEEIMTDVMSEVDQHNSTTVNGSSEEYADHTKKAVNNIMFSREECDSKQQKMRRETAAAVLEAATTAEEALGRRELVDRFYDDDRYTSKNSFWEKDIKPVLQEVGHYDRRERGYVFPEYNQSFESDNQTISEPDLPPVGDAIREQLEQAVPSSGWVAEQRADEILKMYNILRQRGEADRNELLAVADTNATEYATDENMWLNMVEGRDTLRVLPGVEAPTDGKTTWKYNDK